MSKKIKGPQLQLPFIEEMDRQREAERQAKRQRSHERNAACWLESRYKSYPPTAVEWDIMVCGIRLSKFVSDLECEKCNLSCEDHTVGWVLPTKVCLKDYYALLAKLGIK